MPGAKAGDRDGRVPTPRPGAAESQIFVRQQSGGLPVNARVVAVGATGPPTLVLYFQNLDLNRNKFAKLPLTESEAHSRGPFTGRERRFNG